MSEGTVYIRIGPPWQKNGEFWKDVLLHGGFKDKVYCRQNDINPETGKPRKCAVCTRLLELKTDRSPRGKKLWSLIKQRNESLWNVLVAKTKRADDGKLKVLGYKDNRFKVWRLSSKWQNMLIEIFADEDYRTKSILGVTHTKYGRLIKVKREGTGRDDTNYVFLPTDRETPIFPEKSKRKEILKTLVNLDKLVHASSQEEIDAFLSKMERLARKLVAKSRDEDNDSDDEEEDVEDDDTPKKKKKKPRDDDEDDEDDDDHKKVDDDDEDEDEDSDDSDDDEDEMEKKYKKMKKNLKSKRSSEEDEDDE